MMQRAQLLLADVLVDAGHALAAFCSMRARKTMSAVAAASLAWRWKRTAHAAHVEAMLLMDSPAMKLGQVVM